MDVMQYVGYATVILGAAATVAAVVVQTSHALGYEVPVLTRVADGLAKLAGAFSNRPAVSERRARQAK